MSDEDASVVDRGGVLARPAIRSKARVTIATPTSSREPFRLWGLTTVKRDVAEVEAIDLHVGQTLQMDIARGWMRIYLGAGSCGNTVDRLISNLQHRFDGAPSLRDPQIDIAADARSSSPHEPAPTWPVEPATRATRWPGMCARRVLGRRVSVSTTRDQNRTT